MEVVGSASAVISVVQVGFSLAKSIREVLKDYKDATEDLVSLAETIESTMVLVAELETLVRDKDQSKSFSAGGLKTIRKCCRDAGTVVEDLVQLLTKTGAAKNAAVIIEAKDLEISRFVRVNWLSRKSQVKDRQEDLQRIRIEATLALVCKIATEAQTKHQQVISKTILIECEKSRLREAHRHRKRLMQAKRHQRAASPERLPAATKDNAILDTMASNVTPHDASAAKKVPGIPEKDHQNHGSRSAASQKRGDHPAKSIEKVGHATAKGRNENPKSDSPRPTKTQPPVDHLIDNEGQHQISSDVAVEEFKQKTKHELTELLKAFAATQHRIISASGQDLSNDELRKMVEDQHEEEWRRKYADWLPGVQLQLQSTANNSSAMTVTTRTPKKSTK